MPIRARVPRWQRHPQAGTRHCDVVLGLRGLRGRVRELRVRAISVGGHPMVEHLGGTRAGQFACWAGLQWGGAAVVGARYWSDRGGAD